MTKAIISPYESKIVHLKTEQIPCVVDDLGGVSFNSSDTPSTAIDIADGELLIILDETNHAEALNLGYTEVDI